MDKYFYLTREILNQTTDLESNLSDASKKILERIGSVSSALAPRLVDDMKALSPNDVEDVLKIIYEKISKGQIESFLYSLIFVQMKESQTGIINAISKASKKIAPADVISLKNMNNCNSEMVEPLLKILVESGKMKKDVLKEFTREGK